MYTNFISILEQKTVHELVQQDEEASRGQWENLSHNTFFGDYEYAHGQASWISSGIKVQELQ
jgi:hypothetical protein